MARGILSRWNLERARRQRRRYAFLLLTADGAVRSADVVVCYRGTDRLLGTWSRETDRLGPEPLVDHRSMWHTDLRTLWTTVSAGIRTTIRRANRSSWVTGALVKGFRVTHS